jgi:crotonobetainyl-CoA:carnitine CoA-transferase CaiB-like acyl-CoA transferase
LRAVELPDVIAPPALGADTDDVLEEAGISAAARAELRSEGIV